MAEHIKAALIGFQDVVIWTCVGIFVVTFSLALRWALSHSGYLRPSPGGFALRRPWEECAVLGLWALLGLLVPLLVASDGLRPHEVTPRDSWIGAGVFQGICLVGAASLLWGGRPQELAVDEGRRTYRRREGWPPFRRAYAGPLSDLAGVWAEPHTDNHSYLVYVGWRAGLGKMVVGQFGSADGAEYFADELAAVLDIPRLEWKTAFRTAFRNTQ